MIRPVRVLMLHHAFPPLGGPSGWFARDILEALSGIDRLQVDFVSVSESHVYQSETVGDRVVTHRLNVYKGKSKKLTAAELYEYQTKSFIFILRTSRKIRYDLIHALGMFPESLTAYAFRARFPYAVSRLPTDRAAAGLLTDGAHKALIPFGKEILRKASAVFDHISEKPADADSAAKAYWIRYRKMIPDDHQRLRKKTWRNKAGP